MQNWANWLQGEGQPLIGGRAVLPHRHAGDTRRTPPHTQVEARGGQAGIAEEAWQECDAPAEGLQWRGGDESHRVCECHGEWLGFHVPGRKLLLGQPLHVESYGGYGHGRCNKGIPHHRWGDDAPY
jgi:hypothetical protein